MTYLFPHTGGGWVAAACFAIVLAIAAGLAANAIQGRKQERNR